MKSVAKTLFLTSCISYLCFLGIDFFRFGFISRFFWIHWFLLVAIISAVWWSKFFPNSPHS
ncbi:hypothetical protein CO172_00995 [Candidatus Uhrbacteria bacterium CG_4_9_14_3_um_filter_36_7]|uniref:Uncharacterized protein n=1 Tax=Candidatus Uhrbacteria bacterium CG_4_9_14_3_um_filter_36_7 TaxID=1975033 RepID=A0A2M7XI05_9BACT|nr:MAG: hypothetical protein CO172_00995 [Candidatus Uhrbacteria bacterium CG_4_9_14_3_um_filter_36_7]